MTFKSKIIRLFTFSIIAFSIVACNKDNTSSPGKVNFEVTDAPFDDPEVQAVFVTVAAVKVDGKAIDNFSGKTTFDLASYQRGQTKSLGSTNLQSGTYSNVTLVLDNNTDQSGNAPGCYVLTKSGQKKAITAASATSEIALTGQFKSVADQTSTAVIDFDLRKTIAYNSTNGYKFATDSEMSNGIRVVQKSETGVIKGSTTDAAVTSSEKVVVYAYKKGTYNKATEMQGQGSSGITFKNAVTSSVASNGSYELHFLQPGDYELHCISYKDTNKDGKLDIQGEFQASLLGSLNISSVSVVANATVTANINLTAVLPL